MNLHVPSIYLCSLCGQQLRTVGAGGQLADTCSACEAELQRQIAEDALYAYLAEDVQLLIGDLDESPDYLGRLDAMGRLFGWAREATAEDVDLLARMTGLMQP
jgi:hypothetical protein